jgi:hypothetical protein
MTSTCRQNEPKKKTHWQEYKTVYLTLLCCPIPWALVHLLNMNNTESWLFSFAILSVIMFGLGFVWGRSM